MSKPKEEPSRQVSVRLSEKWILTAEEIAEAFSRTQPTGMITTRADILRVACIDGLTRMRVKLVK